MNEINQNEMQTLNPTQFNQSIPVKKLRQDSEKKQKIIQAIQQSRQQTIEEKRERIQNDQKDKNRKTDKNNSTMSSRDKLIEGFSKQVQVYSLKKAVNFFTIEDPIQLKNSIKVNILDDFLYKDTTQITLDSKLLSQIWGLCMQTYLKDQKTDKFEGQMEVKLDYSIKQNAEQHLVFDSFTPSENYFKKLEVNNICKYGVKYICKSVTGDEKSTRLSRDMLSQVMNDINKKVKNANCDEKFYQADLMEAADEEQQQNEKSDLHKYNFDAETQQLTILDSSRIVFFILADQARQKLLIGLNWLVPDVSFTFIQQPKATIVSTPLSRLLLGKQSQDDKKNVQSNFTGDGSKMYSGFLSKDERDRVFPLLPNEQDVFNSPIIGLWFFGVTEINCQYVWSALNRLILCRNFIKQGKVSLSEKKIAFLIVNFNPGKYPQFFQVQFNSGTWKILYHKTVINRESQLQFKPYQLTNMKKCGVYEINEYISGIQKGSQMKDTNKYQNVKEIKQKRQIFSAKERILTSNSPVKYEQIIREALPQKYQQLATLNPNEETQQSEIPLPSSFNMLPAAKDSQFQINKNELSGGIPNQNKQSSNHSNTSSQNLNRSRNSLSKQRQQQLDKQKKKDASQLIEAANIVPLTKDNLNMLDQADNLRTSQELQIQQILKHQSNTSRSRSIKNQLQHQQDMKQEIHAKQNILQNNFVQCQVQGLEHIHASPRSIQHFISQQNQINSLTTSLSQLSQQVQNLTMMLHQQQLQINKNVSQQTTAYQTAAIHPLASPPLVSQYQSAAYSSINYQIEGYETNDLQQMNSNLLISQPTAEFPLNMRNLNSSPKIQQSYKQRYELGQIETLGRLDFYPNPNLQNQPLGQNLIQEEEKEVKQRSKTRSNNTSLIDDQEIPIPDRSILGEKRSRNQRKTKQQLNNINEQAGIPRQNTHQFFAQNNILQNLQDVVSSQTVSELSAQKSGSNSKFKRSQSSVMSNTMGNELNAIKTNLKNQYEDQFAGSRPKGSRNVLNNVNKQVNKKKRSSSPSKSSESSQSLQRENKSNFSSKNHSQRIQSSSSSDSDKGVDHTYNPFNFKNLQNKLFKKPLFEKPKEDNSATKDLNSFKQQFQQLKSLKNPVKTTVVESSQISHIINQKDKVKKKQQDLIQQEEIKIGSSDKFLREQQTSIISNEEKVQKYQQIIQNPQTTQFNLVNNFFSDIQTQNFDILSNFSNQASAPYNSIQNQKQEVDQKLISNKLHEPQILQQIQNLQSEMPQKDILKDIHQIKQGLVDKLKTQNSLNKQLINESSQFSQHLEDINDEEESKIILKMQDDRQGKTDWTMDLPKISFAVEDEEDDDEEAISQSDLHHGNIHSDNDGDDDEADDRSENDNQPRQKHSQLQQKKKSKINADVSDSGSDSNDSEL